MRHSEASSPAFRTLSRAGIALALVASLCVILFPQGVPLSAEARPTPDPAQPQVTERPIQFQASDIGQLAARPIVASATAADGTTVLLDEGFEGAWPPAGWAVQPHWGASTCQAFSGTRSAWVMGDTGAACGSHYLTDESAFLIAGPFNLADATQASLAFRLWLNGNSLCLAASPDGLSFGGYCTAGYSHGWIPRSLDLTDIPGLGSLSGQSQVWIAIAWSTGRGTYPDGAFVDDVRLNKTVGGPTITPRPTRTLTPTPTRTPTPVPSPSVSWQIQTVYSGAGGETTSIALDGAGRPWVSFQDPVRLKLAHWDGAMWRSETVDDAVFVGDYSSLRLDSGGRARVAYNDAFTSNDLKYAQWDGASWHLETVDSAGDVGKGVSLALDSYGNPHIAYMEGNPDRVKYARWDGSAWHIEAVSDASWAANNASIALDTSNRPHIAYAGESGLVYARWDGSAWLKTDVDTGYALGAHASIALDSAQRPRIAYRDGNARTLMYAWWTGSAWQIETVDSSVHIEDEVALALGSSDRPAIAYRCAFDDNTGALKYARWDGAAWRIDYVETGNLGQGVSLALSADGRPRIAYYDEGGNKVKLAQQADTSATATPTPITPTPVVPSGQADAYAPEIAAMPGGGVVVVWHDNRFGSSYHEDVFARRFTAGGDPAWPSVVRVSAGDGKAYEEDPAIAADALGNSWVVWESDGQIVAQRLSSAGQRLLARDVVVMGSHNGKTPRVALNSLGQPVVMYSLYFDSCTVNAPPGAGGACDQVYVRQLAEGWETNLRGYIYAFANWPDLAVDDKGTIRTAWQEGSPGTASRVYGEFLDSIGQTSWPNPIRFSLDDSVVPHAHPRVAVGPEGITYAVWADRRSGDWDVYLQKLDATMTHRLWAADLRVNGDSIVSDQVEPDLVAGPGGSVYVVWADDRDGLFNIYGQRVSSDGSRLWPQDVRVNTHTAADRRGKPVVALDSTGALYVAWESQQGSQHDIFFTSLSTSGAHLWPVDLTAEGLPVPATPTGTPNPAVPPTATRTRAPTLTNTPTWTPGPTWTPYPPTAGPSGTRTQTATATRTPGPALVMHWAPTGLTAKAHSVAVSPSFAADRTLFAGGEGVVYRSTNGGTTWTPVSLAAGAVNNVAVSPAFASDRTVFATLVGDGVWKSTNAGVSWTRIRANTEVWQLVISPAYASDRTVFFGSSASYGEGANGVFRSRDGGASWSRVNTGLFNVFVWSLAISPNYAVDHTLIAGTNGGPYMTTNGGDSWSRFLVGWLLGPIWPVEIAPTYAAEGTAFIVVGSSPFVRSSDGQWHQGSAIALDKVTALTFSPGFATDRTMYAGTDGSGVLRSTSEGTTWQAVNFGLDAATAEGLAVALDGTLYAATETGVWVSAQGAQPTATTGPPTRSPTPSRTPTASGTPTPSRTSSPTRTSSRTATPTIGASATRTATPTPSRTRSASATSAPPTATRTPTGTPTPTRPAGVDLVVLEVWTAPLSPIPGVQAVVKAQIANRGSAAANGVIFVGLYQDKAASGSPDAQAFFVGLASDARVIVTFPVTFTAGPHVVTAWADWNGQVTEADEANNSAWGLVEALPRVTPSHWGYLPLCEKGE